MEIVGYYYKGGFYHVSCIVRQVVGEEAYRRQRWFLDEVKSVGNVEIFLDNYAARDRINRENETSFPASLFPKRVLRAMVRGDRCAGCEQEMVSAS